jgi:hypothetical protein
MRITSRWSLTLLVAILFGIGIDLHRSLLDAFRSGRMGLLDGAIGLVLGILGGIVGRLRGDELPPQMGSASDSAAAAGAAGAIA